MVEKEENGKLGVLLVFIVAIVVSIVLLNGLLISPDDSYQEWEIPDYGIGEFVEYVNDGDTFKTVEGDYVRLLGINTEEKGQPHAVAATHKLEELLTRGQVRLERDIEDKDVYGRLLRYVYAGDTFVNLELVRGGYAHVYVIEPNVKHWDELKAAEQEAISNQSEIWQPSPFQVEITNIQPVQQSGTDGLYYEAVTFKNNGTIGITMTNWTVKDESTHIFKFTAFYLNPGDSVTLRSGFGATTITDVFWNLDTSIWNNDGDICFIRDENGLLVDAWRYDSVSGTYVWWKYPY